MQGAASWARPDCRLPEVDAKAPARRPRRTRLRRRCPPGQRRARSSSKPLSSTGSRGTVRSAAFATQTARADRHGGRPVPDADRKVRFRRRVDPGDGVFVRACDPDCSGAARDTGRRRSSAAPLERALFEGRGVEPLHRGVAGVRNPDRADVYAAIPAGPWPASAGRSCAGSPGRCVRASSPRTRPRPSRLPSTPALE